MVLVKVPLPGPLVGLCNGLRAQLTKEHEVGLTPRHEEHEEELTQSNQATKNTKKVMLFVDALGMTAPLE
jgi:hypothetical protein